MARYKILFIGLFFIVGVSCFGQELQVVRVERNPGWAWNSAPGAWPVGGVGEQWNDLFEKYNLVSVKPSDPFEKSNGLEDRIGELAHSSVADQQPHTIYLIMGNRRFICFIYHSHDSVDVERSGYYAWVYEVK